MQLTEQLLHFYRIHYSVILPIQMVNFLLKPKSIRRKIVTETPLQKITNISIKNSKLIFSTSSPANTVVISIFSSIVKKYNVKRLNKIETGIHTISIPGLADGLYIMHITIDLSVLPLDMVWHQKTGLHYSILPIRCC